ncbi:MAG: hypothetical protein D6731_04070 [Planctomycetota bacterium]|nr:MAG: hypothetical protein D6731_04070 [Planctomycetota bacterium]
MRRCACLLSLVLALGGCDDDAPTRAISHTRVATVPAKRFYAQAKSSDRFGRFPAAPPPSEGSPHGETSPAPFAYDLPEGWHAHPPQGMRLLSFHVGGGHGAECSVVHLPGGGGGTLANVNRWRKQMGLAAIDGAALAALPSVKVLGRQGVLVELEGSYSGMGGEAKPDHALVGVIVPHVLSGRAGTLFIKMVGPKQTVAGERAHFLAFCSSLRPAGDGGHARAPADGDHTAGAPSPEAAGPPRRPPLPKLRWQTPKGWSERGPRPMREVTFSCAESPGVECYVTVLRGEAGGVRENVNRWRKQIGQEPLSDAEVSALPTLRVLDRDATLLDAQGTLETRDGPKADHRLLGLVCPQEGFTVFVKLTGPAEEVQRERTRFRALCASLALAAKSEEAQ